MKKIFLLMALLSFAYLSVAQTRVLVVRRDSVAINSYSMSGKGSLNILDINNPKVTKVTVTLMQGKRPVFTAQFASIAEFNRSGVNSSIRAMVSPGSRLMIQLDGLNIIKVLPVVD